MTLDDLRQFCADSTREDWNVIHCGGAFLGPSYLDQFGQAESAGTTWLEHQQGMRFAPLTSPILP